MKGESCLLTLSRNLYYRRRNSREAVLDVSPGVTPAGGAPGIDPLTPGALKGRWKNRHVR